MRRRLQGLTPTRVLLVVAFLEIAINRIAIGSRTAGFEGLLAPLLPKSGEPPTWHTVLSYAGLFLYYFTGTLAVGLIGVRCEAALRGDARWRDRIAAGALAIAALLAAPSLVDSVPDLALPLEVAFAIAVCAQLVTVFGGGGNDLAPERARTELFVGVALVALGLAITIGSALASGGSYYVVAYGPVFGGLALLVRGAWRRRDPGVEVGTFAIAVPLLVHGVSAYGARYVWPEGAMDGTGATVAHVGLVALCVAALVSPYCFAPRPFARAVTRPMPVLFAMAIAAIGAISARAWYPTVAKAAKLAIGVELDTTQGDPRLAFYLLAIATLGWTLMSCMLAAAEARRTIGAGLALVVFGGYAFAYPDHYLLVLVGLSLVVDGARRVRDEELAILPIASDTPPIADAAWSSYITTVTTALRRTLDGVHALTTRGEAEATSSVIVGEKRGLVVRARIERVEASVVALDVVVGREIDEMRGATLVLWAIPPRGLGTNPPAPPAAPMFKTGDAAFDGRFKLRGSSLACGKLLDDGLRARAAATLDGWLAYWEPEGLRYRVYPGRGAPLDHPIPLSDLALGRAATPERLVAVIELLVEIASRGVTSEAREEPELGKGDA